MSSRIPASDPRHARHARHAKRALGAASVALLTVVAYGCGDGDAPIAATPRDAGRCDVPPRGGDAPVALAPALGGARFASPIEIVLGPAGRLYLLEQAGVVRAVDPSDPAAAPTEVLDIAGRIVSGMESGLLGIAFSPDFDSSGAVYLHYTVAPPTPSEELWFSSVIARYRSTDGGVTIDPSTEERIVVLDQPFHNHNGGKIAFGPDGYLYVAFGDGGNAGDPRNYAQNLDVLYGKILRIDPRGGAPYAIPPDNPFAGGGGRPEIYAYGLRNPWKMAFDTVTGELWSADVGQSAREEVNRIVLGGNYGWKIREGTLCYQATECRSDGLIAPVVEYGRSEGVSITGGYVYRGSKIPSLYGKYVFGDFGSGNVWAVDKDAAGEAISVLLVASGMQISTFGQDADGEIYVADFATGRVDQLVPAEAQPSAPALVSLGATGCVDVNDPSRPPPGLVPYEVNSPLWSDGADKDRWVFVPAGKTIGVGEDGDFDLPPGSVAVKTFSIAGRRIETRLFARYEDGAWAGFSYEWNDEQTDATLLETGKRKALAGGGSWYFPSRSECTTCHTAAAGFTLGLEARQLDRDAGGRNQLARFAPLVAAEHHGSLATGTFGAPLRAAIDAAGTSEERARSYLHANCSSCHRPGSVAGGAALDLRASVPLAATGVCGAIPRAGDLGAGPEARVVLPGDPARSVLLTRVRAVGAARMPPLATSVVDDAGAYAIEAWIRELAGCP